MCLRMLESVDYLVQTVEAAFPANALYYAGLQRAASEQEAEKLLHPLTDIPKSAAEVSTLLKQQRLPVNAQAAAILQSSRAHQKIVISNSYMAQILGVKLTNIASVNATGEEIGPRAYFADRYLPHLLVNHT